jgi:hypothetical protein
VSQNAVWLPQESNLGESVPNERGDAGPWECLRGGGRRREGARPIRSENLDQPPTGGIRERLKLLGALSGGISPGIEQQVSEPVDTPLQCLGSPGRQSIFQVEPHDGAEQSQTRDEHRREPNGEPQ